MDFKKGNKFGSRTLLDRDKRLFFLHRQPWIPWAESVEPAKTLLYIERIEWSRINRPPVDTDGDCCRQHSSS